MIHPLKWYRGLSLSNRILACIGVCVGLAFWSNRTPGLAFWSPWNFLQVAAAIYIGLWACNLLKQVELLEKYPLIQLSGDPSQFPEGAHVNIESARPASRGGYVGSELKDGAAPYGGPGVVGGPTSGRRPYQKFAEVRKGDRNGNLWELWWGDDVLTGSTSKGRIQAMADLINVGRAEMYLSQARGAREQPE